MKQYWHSRVQVRMWNEFCDSAQKLNNSLFRSSFDSHRKNSIPSYEFQNLIFFLNLSSLSIWLFDSIIITPIQLVSWHTRSYSLTQFFLGFSLLNSIYGYLCLNPVMHFNENTNMYLFWPFSGLLLSLVQLFVLRLVMMILILIPSPSPSS